MNRIAGLSRVAALLFGLWSVSSGQQIDSELPLIGGGFKLEQPVAMAISPSGERIAVSDASANRIYVIDLSGRLIWVAGEQMDLQQPSAVCFESETSVLYVPRNGIVVLRLSEENPRAVDTVAELPAPLLVKGWAGVDRIRRTARNEYLLLNEKAGEVAMFTKEWTYDRTVVERGSGRGKVLAPTSIPLTATGKLIVTDRKNYPVQFFAADGKFLIYGGWNLPSEQRGWQAVAGAVDSRDFIWVADETNAAFRIFDQSGTQVSSVGFRNRSVSPVAMEGTIDNRMAVLEETGTLLFYTLE